jgi:hypothetical protein
MQTNKTLDKELRLVQKVSQRMETSILYLILGVKRKGVSNFLSYFRLIFFAVTSLEKYDRLIQEVDCRNIFKN